MAYLIDEPGLVKPEVPFVLEDGNIFSIIGKIAREWRRKHRSDIADELGKRLLSCHSYDGPDGSLALAMQYCDEESIWESEEEDWNPYADEENDDDAE